jgi:hypothetical protein
MEAVADPSLADRRALNKFGIAIAAMIKMIATTINSSINENPLLMFFLFFISKSPFFIGLLEWDMMRKKWAH